MTTLTKSTEQEVTWSKEIRADLILRDATLTDTIGAVMRGVERIVKGEGVEVDPDDLPTDDDE